MDDKSPMRHWSTTEDGSLLARCTTFLYKKIISTEDDGLHTFFLSNCSFFVGIEDVNTNENSFKCYEIFREYEHLIERAMDEFALLEGVKAQEIMRRISLVVDKQPKASKSLKVLLAAAEYRKFVSLMVEKAKEHRGDLVAQQQNAVHSSNNKAESKHAVAGLAHSIDGLPLPVPPPLYASAKECSNSGDYKDYAITGLAGK